VHGADTIKGGRYLNNPEMVRQFAKTIREDTKQLQDWGVKFGLDEDENPAVLKIPGHSHARHLFGQNWKGSDLVFPLKQKARKCKVRFYEHCFVSGLLMSDNRVCGAAGITEKGTFRAIQSRTVVLATGGFGQVFLNTNNAPGITGDGQALGYRAGAVLQDMEFVQFYPTAMGRYGSRILLNERLLAQEGVTIKNHAGQDIFAKNGYTNPAGITRDELAQVIMKEILATPGLKKRVVFDLEGLSGKAATELTMLLPSGWFKGERQFDVSPTTHFCMGGVAIDKYGETSCSGLFAAGEVSAGAHGANRLGGNALAEVIALGGWVGSAAAKKAASLNRVSEFENQADAEHQRVEFLSRDQGKSAKKMMHTLKQIMWVNAGIIRNQSSMEKAMRQLEELDAEPVMVKSAKDLIRCLELKNMILVSQAVCKSAVERKESRGSHFRTDFPKENNQEWLKNIQIRKTAAGLTLEMVPVPGPCRQAATDQKEVP
jgi:succinate dehydrogenase/fumarate reductase flavoprotein subunit